MRIRAMDEGDLDWVQALDGSTATAPHWARATYAAFLREQAAGELRRSQAIVAEEAGARIGYAVAQLLLDGVDNLCELEFLLVDENYRRQGVGRALLAAIRAWASGQGALRLVLEVRAGNAAARRLYRAEGFEEDGLRKGYYHAPEEDAVLMSLYLRAVEKVKEKYVEGGLPEC
jgi:[ribosomal protein S18]-alanine N-acetyltransferase